MEEKLTGAEWFGERLGGASATSWDTNIELMTSRGLEVRWSNWTHIKACVLARAVQHWRASWKENPGSFWSVLVMRSPVMPEAALKPQSGPTLLAVASPGPAADHVRA